MTTIIIRYVIRHDPVDVPAHLPWVVDRWDASGECRPVMAMSTRIRRRYATEAAARSYVETALAPADKAAATRLGLEVRVVID